ncbi:MAG: hypothetical protein IKY70_05735, partial [Bacteroidales bacterium]|nr:hypothetical protein [Bacteroidales bacterium]
MMNRYKLMNSNGVTRAVLLVATMFAIVQTMNAQQRIDPTVEVEKEFDSKMTNIVKTPLNTAIPDSLTSFNLDFNYSIFDKPYKDLYEFSPLPSAKLQSSIQEKYPVLMAKAGIGYQLSPIGEIYYQPELGRSNRLSLKAYYDGYFGKNYVWGTDKNGTAGKIRGAKVAVSDTVYGAGANYGHNWENTFFNLGLDYTGNSYTNYGFSEERWEEAISSGEAVGEREYMKENYRNKYRQITASSSIGSIDSYNRRARFNYLANLSFKNTLYNPAEYAIRENLLCANGHISPAFSRFSRFTLEINSENIFLESDNNARSSYGIFDVIPSFTWNKKRFRLQVGIKLSGKYKNGTNASDADKYHNYLFAAVDFSYNILKNNLWFYANIDGKNNINSYSSILEENKWIDPHTGLKTSSMPIIINAGIKGKFVNKFGYDAYVKFVVHKGLQQYAYIPWDENNAKYNTLSTIYSNCNELTFGATLNWKSKDLEAGTTIEYSNYSNNRESSLVFIHQPLGYPPFKWDIYATYNLRERLYAGISAKYRSKCESYWGYKYTLYPIYTYIDSYLDLAFTLRYVINNNFSVFANGENLLNDQIAYLPLYIEKGISFTAGLLVKF